MYTLANIRQIDASSRKKRHTITDFAEPALGRYVHWARQPLVSTDVTKAVKQLEKRGEVKRSRIGAIKSALRTQLKPSK